MATTKMSKLFESIESKQLGGFRDCITTLLTLPAFLWIAAVLWFLDREDFYRTEKWCFAKRINTSEEVG